LREPPLSELLALDDATFRAFFSGSPVKRIGRGRFVRNVLIAVGNSGDTSLTPIVQGLLGDASPLVRGAAIWALSRLLSDREFGDLAATTSRTETDTAVREEWMAALAEPVKAD
jgi:epoxyqueuosine reductase